MGMGIVTELGMGMGMGRNGDCTGMEGNGNVKSHSRTSLVRCGRFPIRYEEK